MIAALAAVIVGLVAPRRQGATPAPPASDGVRLGSAFAPFLAGSLADGFEAGADLLARGRPIAEVDRALKATFLESRERAFRERAAPSFEAIVPSGSEPGDKATRSRYEWLLRDFARGLRGAR